MFNIIKSLKKFLALVLISFSVGLLVNQIGFISISPDAYRVLGQAEQKCGNADRTKNILCLKKNLENEVAHLGIKPFIEALAESLKEKNTDGNAITQCHDIAHAIGQIGGANSNNLNKTLSQCNDLCTFGCYHGVVEGYVSKGKELTSSISSLCRGDISRTDSLACFHGLGHGVASVAGFELNRSLDLCDLLQNNEEKRSCGAGVIMELYEPSSFTHPLLAFPKDIPSFCNELPSPYDEVCLVTAGLHEYGRSQNIDKAFQTCQRVPLHLVRQCNVSVGQNFYFVFQGSAKSIINSCGRALKKDYYNACLEGAVISSRSSDSKSRGEKLCQLVDNEFRETCYQLLHL